MPHLPFTTLLGALLPLWAADTVASTLQRCEDASGHITFTSHGCAPTQHSQTVEAYNAPPGSEPPAFFGLYPQERTYTPQREIVVVGQREDGCGNRLSAEQRRLAILDRRTPSGMTRRDVESLLGRPDRTTHRNGETSYHYILKTGRHQVSFDQYGCVK